jgi:parallel beta-helix repeat protein
MHWRASTAFAATLLALVVSLFVYITISNAQPYQNDSMGISVIQDDPSQGATAALAGDEISPEPIPGGTLAYYVPSPGQQNTSGPQQIPGSIPPESEYNLSVPSEPTPQAPAPSHAPLSAGAIPSETSVTGTPPFQAPALPGNPFPGAPIRSVRETVPFNLPATSAAIAGASVSSVSSEASIEVPVPPVPLAPLAAGASIASEYGVMDNDPNVNCPRITASGTYVMPGDYSGSPTGTYGPTCVQISASNVLFNCAGHSISNGVGGTPLGVVIIGTANNVTLENCAISNYAYGVYTTGGYLTNSTFLNNTVTSTTRGALYLSLVSNSTIYDNRALSNSGFGIYLGTASNNNVSNNVANNNGPSSNQGGGLWLDYNSNGNLLYNNTANGNRYGIYVYGATGNNISNTSAANNVLWSFVSTSGSVNNVVQNLNMSNSVVSFTSKDISIRDAANPMLPPDPPGVTDINRFMEVTSNNYDSYVFLNVSYTAADVVSIDPSTLYMMKSAGGILEPPSNFSTTYGVDTANKFVYANITNFGSVFGIISGGPLDAYTLYVNCPALNSPGAYVMARDFTGSPAWGSGCIIINTSNVALDCAGHTITNNGTGSAMGIVLNPYSNISVSNCNISGYNYGIESYGYNSTLTNNTVNNGYAGIMLAYPSSNNTVSNNTAHNNSNYGVEFYQTANNTVCNNNFDSNYNAGIGTYSYSYSITGNVICNNSANNNNQYGIYFGGVSNFLYNNTANNNHADGILFYASSGPVQYNLLYNNTANNNSYNGIELTYASNNTIYNNIASNNGFPANEGYGIRVYNSSGNAIYNNTANNNSYSGIDLESRSNQNNMHDNTANGNHQNGIVLYFSVNNSISNSTAANNTLSAFSSTSGSIGNPVRNLSVGNNTVSFDSKDININDAPHPPATNPSGVIDIHRFVNATANSGDSFLFLNLSYTAADVASLDETQLFMAKYTSSWDTSTSDFATSYGVDTANKFVYANITNFGSTFGIMSGNVSPTIIELYSNCPVIASPGNYQLMGGSSGAPTNVTPMGDVACVIVNASFVTLDCAGNAISNNGVGGTTSGLLVTTGSSHVTVENCQVSGYTYGLQTYQTSASVLRNIEAYSNYIGIYVHYGNGMTVADSHAYNNPSSGLYIDASSGTTVTDSTFEQNLWDVNVWPGAPWENPSWCTNTLTNVTGTGGLPIYHSYLPVNLANVALSELILCGASGSNVTNVTVDGGTGDANNGMLIERVKFVTVRNSVSSNNWEGIQLMSNGGNNTFDNLTLAENTYYDFDYSGWWYVNGSDNSCANSVTNVTGSAGRPINYSYAPVNWDGITPSEAFLCGGGVNGSNITNTVVNGSDTLKNDGIFLTFVTNVTVINTTSNENRNGILGYSSWSTYTNDTLDSNYDTGLVLSSSTADNSFNQLANNTASSNGWNGFMLQDGYNNVVQNNVLNYNGVTGLALDGGFNSNNLTNNTMYNNSQNGLWMRSCNGNLMDNNTAQENHNWDFWNEAQGTSDCNNTIIRFNGSAGRPINYSYTAASWSGTTSSEIFLCNADYSQLSGVTVDGSDSAYNNGLVMYFTDYSNVTGSVSNNNLFGYFVRVYSTHNNLSGNTAINDSNQGFLLYWYSNNNFLGNNYAYGTIDGFKFDTYSDYNTLDNNTADSNINTGFYSWYSDYNNLTNNLAVHNRYYYGFGMDRSNHFVYENDTAHDNYNHGFYAGSSQFNTYVNASSYNNNGYGILLSSSNNNLIYGSNASDGYSNGIELIASNYNSVHDNVANNNSANKGIDLYISDNNTLYNNVADNNALYGIYVYADSNNNTLYNNTADNNPQYGFYFGSGWNNMSNGTASNSSYGIYLESDNNFVTNSLAMDDYYSGVFLYHARNNLVTDIALDNNYGGGIYLYASVNNSFAGIICRNYGGGFYLYGGDYYNPNGGSNNNSFTDSNLSDGARCGSVYLDYSHNNSFVNIDASYGGVSLYGADNNTFLNINASNGYGGVGVYGDNNHFTNVEANNVGYYAGFYLSSAYNNSLLNVTASNNSQYGIDVYCSNYNNITNSTVQENGQLDFNLWPSCDPYSPPQCQNSVDNMLGSGDRQVFYSNTSSTSLDGAQVSEIVLCQAHNSVITNTVVKGSDTLFNDGVLIFNTFNSVVSNLSSSDNFFGVYTASSNGNSFTNTTATGNAQSGFTLYQSYVTDISSSESSGNAFSGFSLDHSGATTLSNDVAVGNGEWAFTSTAELMSDVATNLSMDSVNVSFDAFDANVRNATIPVVTSIVSGSPGAEINLQSTNAPYVMGYYVTAAICDGNGHSESSATFLGNYSGAWSYMTNDTGAIHQSDVPVYMTPLSSPTVIWDSSSNATSSLSAPIPIGFSVPMFGRNDNYVTVSTDGSIYLNDGPPLAEGPCGYDGDHWIGLYQGDLQVYTGDVEYGTAGSAPNRVFVVYFNNVSPADFFHSYASYDDGGYTFQIKLFENATPMEFSTDQIQDPTGYVSTGRYVEATGNPDYWDPPYLDPYLFLNISYLDSDLATDLGDMSPDTLQMFKHPDTYLDSSWYDPTTFVTPIWVDPGFVYVYGVDTVNHFVYANISNFGSIFAPFGASLAPPPVPPTPPTPPSSSSPTPTVPLFSSRAACPADEVMIYSVPGAFVRVMITSPYGGVVNEGLVGGDGTITFELPASGSYRATATKAGYTPATTSFSFDLCPVEAPPPVTPPTIIPGCTSDDQCPMTHFCNLTVHVCQPVVGICGFADNHTWYKYECCVDADCPSLNATEICLLHKCHILDLTGDKEGLVGYSGKVRATIDGKPFVNATLQILLPDGASFHTITDTKGEFLLPFDFEGNYTVRLVVSNTSVKTHLIAVALPPPVTPTPRPAIVEDPTKYCWALPLIVAMILAYLAYRKWRADRNKKKGQEARK